MVNPPAPYFGGKQQFAEKIAALFGPHQHYVEPFAGGLSVLLAKAPSALETVNDIDGDVVTFWRVLRDRPDEFERVCALTPHARGEHGLSRVREGVSDVERARRVWVALTQGRAGGLMRTGWRTYKTGPTGMPDVLASYVSRIGPAAARLAKVSLECRPALEVIEDYGHDAGALLYVDPPYLGQVRGSTSSYRFEMKDEQRHRQLLELLLDLDAAVVISGYASDLYDSTLDGWERTEIRAQTTQGISTSASAATTRVEVVWSNRPAPQQMALDLSDDDSFGVLEGVG